jgi:hypothetical protein
MNCRVSIAGFAAASKALEASGADEPKAQSKPATDVGCRQWPKPEVLPSGFGRSDEIAGQNL